MLARIPRLLTLTAIAISALTLGGCASVERAGTNLAIKKVFEERITPEVMKLGDVDMVCSFSYVNAPLITAMRSFHGEPELMETVMLSAGGVCSDAQAVTEELRYLRASREKRPDDAQDARIAQKRLLALTAQRQYTAFLRMKTRLEAKYSFKYGSSKQNCPDFDRDFDEFVYLMGTISGLQAMQNDIAAQQSVGVPTDIAPLADTALTCLNNAKWWGVPEAARATVWSIIPGAGQGRDIKGTFEKSMTLGEAKGVRLAHVMAAMAAQSSDDIATVKEVIKRFANVQNFTPSKDYQLIDAIAQEQMQNISDRLWTQNAGTRTPLASLGKFWDDKVGGDVNADEFLK
ncbi:MAG TPA: hypothetical protein VFM33_09710 [Aquabacterium sp.]|nr:hypothetical protein [Aquabacterium sp.]